MSDETMIPEETSAVLDLGAVLEPETTELEPIEVFTADDLQARLASRDAEWEAKLSAKDSEIAAVRSEFDRVTVERSLSDAARSGDAFSPEQILPLLRPHTRMVNGEPIVELEGFVMSPSEVITWMRSQPDRFGNLFRSSLIAGIGSSSTAGGMRSGRALDVRNMGPAEYRAARKEGLI